MSKRNRVKRYPKRILVPLTGEQHERLYDNWLAGAPAIVEQVRQLIDKHFAIPAQPDRSCT